MNNNTERNGMNAALMKQYSVKAVTSDDGTGFVGVYTIPGKDSQLARDENGRIEIFETEEEAIAAAGEDLCEAMNNRTRGHAHSFGYQVMGGAELALRLARLGIDKDKLAKLYGTTPHRVLEWIEGHSPVPRPLNLLLELLSIHGMVELAMEFTHSITFKKGEEPQPRKSQTRPTEFLLDSKGGG